MYASLTLSLLWDSFYRTSQNRKRNLKWLNFIHSEIVKSNLTRYFLKVAVKHFPRHHFNFLKLSIKTTSKSAVAHMKNVQMIIPNHDANLPAQWNELASSDPSQKLQALEYETSFTQSLPPAENVLGQWLFTKRKFWQVINFTHILT